MFVVASTEENQKIINEIISLGANDYTNSIYLKKGISNPIYRMISNEAYNNDLTYKNIKNTLSILYKDDKSVATFSPNTPNLAFSTRKLLNNKRSTKELLKLNGISVPDGMVFIDGNKALTYFNNKKTPQVIKPLTGSGGKGVTANIQASEEKKIKNNSSIYGLNSVAIPEVDGSYTFIFEGLVSSIEQFKLNYLEKLKLRKVSIYSTEC